jgi:hypothetical protein
MQEQENSCQFDDSISFICVFVNEKVLKVLNETSNHIKDGATTLSILTFSTTTLSINALFVTLRINDIINNTQHNNSLHKWLLCDTQHK